MSRRMMMSTLVLASLVSALTSCRDAGIREPSSTDDVHVTARALAAVSAEHLGKPSQAQVEQDPFGLDHPIAATSARYHTPSDDGDEVTVEVGTGLDRRMHMCSSEESRGGCFSLGRVRVIWSPEIPEEDPGSIAVVAPREGGVYAVAGYSGTAITGDPRKLDLSLPLDDLIALARDARVDRTTTQAAVDAGANLDFWTFG
jgi:hypothetical protein